MQLILTIVAVFLLLAASEIWWRVRRPHDEFSRKFIHISVGTFAAFWPWYLTTAEIVFMAAAFIVGVLVSQYLNVFQAIHAVERPTWGELCFAAAVGLLALITDNPWIYAVALLHMAVADGLAAIIGTRYGRSTQYKVFGHTKSVVGSLTFLAVSLVLLLGYGAFVASAPPLVVLVLMALVATGAENVAVRGLDNLLVPVFIAVTLLHFS